MPEPKKMSVLLVPQWTVTLVVRRAPGAAAQLDAAFVAVLRALHGWAPPPTEGGDRHWGLMQLQQANAPIFADEGQAGMALEFTTTAHFKSAQATP